MASDQGDLLEPPWLDIPDPLAARAESRAPTPPSKLPPNPSPTRQQVRLRKALAVVVGVVWPAVVLAHFGLRDDDENLHLVIAQAVLWGGLLLAAGYTALTRGKH